MNEIDYVILAVLLISVIVGVVRGAVREVINIMGWLAALVLAQMYAKSSAVWLAEWIGEPSVRFLVAWMGIFLLTLILFGLIGSLIAGAVRKLGLGGLDRMGGAVIGIIRGGLILVVLAWLAGLTTLPAAPIWKQSLFAPWLERVALQARQVLPPELAARITFGKQRA
jgi:membrane protein required for colicin V production